MQHSKQDSLVIRRILGIEPKNRVVIHTMLEKEFYEIIKREGLDLATVVNLGVEKVLKEKGLL
ncbi:hypothetical protein DRP04_08625 [Archaeoglobales archaeon]|nr:MAG: hypothetical protein DRP04_08625 [Archaeoglobales archaeon]